MMHAIDEIRSWTKDQIFELVVELFARIDDLDEKLRAANEENRRLRAEIDELKRGGKRQASPFSKNSPKKDPKRPGRKPGSGTFSRRGAPDRSECSEPPIDVPVEVDVCPDCGGKLDGAGEETVTITDIPSEIRPTIRAFRIHRCRCRSCGRQFRGRHPDVAADQFGATSHRVGERLKAIAHKLHYGDGISQRRTARIIKDVYGIVITPSALTHDALRLSRRTAGVAYNQLRQELPTRNRVHTDDTGWRIAGHNSWLMTFHSPEETLFQIRTRHSNRQVREVIASDYAGVLHTDRFSSYDADELSQVDQQKCLAHVQRNLRDAIEAQSGAARSLPLKLKNLVSEAIELWHTRDEQIYFRERAASIQQRLDNLLRPRSMRSSINHRLVRELGWHNDRGNLLRFLREPDVAVPTNNAAERALRPAVIARKISQCSKNADGANAHAIFTSIIATLRQRGAVAMIDDLLDVLCTGSIPASLIR